MAKEKINTIDKKHIANMGLKGSQFKELSKVLKVCESTVRKANGQGLLLNKIDDLETSNRMKDVQISILKSSKSGSIRKSSKN